MNTFQSVAGSLPFEYAPSASMLVMLQVSPSGTTKSSARSPLKVKASASVADKVVLLAGLSYWS
jgi:hypothetical protein